MTLSKYCKFDVLGVQLFISIMILKNRATYINFAAASIKSTVWEKTTNLRQINSAKKVQKLKPSKDPGL